MSHYPETGELRSEKILPSHWERLAVVYVRQSTLQQVRLSSRINPTPVWLGQSCYCALAASEERVLVIDKDLGKSGASAQGREGFQRLVAEVGLNSGGTDSGCGNVSLSPLFAHIGTNY